MTRGTPHQGHPADLALKNDNSIAKHACHLPSDIFGGPGFPVQVEARVKVLSLSMRFAYNGMRRQTRRLPQNLKRRAKTIIPEGHASIKISVLIRKPSKAAPAHPAPLGRLFWQSRGGLPAPCPLEPQVRKLIKFDAPLPHVFTLLV